MPPRKLVSALEGLRAQSQSLETEVVLYARIGNPDGLKQAVREEKHVQLETEFTNGTRARVRKVESGQGVQYFFTFKLKDRQDQDDQVIESSRERTTEVDEGFFQDFYKVAYREVKKTRYVFNSNSVTLTLKKSADDTEAEKIALPAVEFEVDLFDGQPTDGAISGGQIWCKIDVEVDNILAYLKVNRPELKDVNLHLGVSNLPFSPQSIIQATTENAQEREQITELWTFFAKSLVDMTPAK